VALFVEEGGTSRFALLRSPDLPGSKGQRKISRKGDKGVNLFLLSACRAGNLIGVRGIRGAGDGKGGGKENS